MCSEVGLKQKLRVEVRSRDPSSTEGTGLGVLQTLLLPPLSGAFPTVKLQC